MFPKVTEQKGELARREELSVASDHRVAELERKIARMRGTMSPENGRARETHTIWGVRL